VVVAMRLQRNTLFKETIICTTLLLLCVLPRLASAQRDLGNEFAGRQYTIYLYNTDEGKAIMSFEENMSLTIDVYDGFGLYTPLGTLFIASYWAPNYRNKNDLLLIFNGGVISDFIWGWGLALPGFQLTGIFFFFGYEK
jgi:hypothetical protein